MSKYLTESGRVDVYHLLAMGLSGEEISYVFCSENHDGRACNKCGKPDQRKLK